MNTNYGKPFSYFPLNGKLPSIQTSIKECSDKVENGINTLYDAIRQKDIIENEYNDLFPRVSDIVNLNCSEFILDDNYYMTTFKYLNMSYHDYYSALCTVFPVANTGSDTNIIM